MTKQGFLCALCLSLFSLASTEALAIQYRVYWTAGCSCNGNQQILYAGLNYSIADANSVKAAAARCARVDPSQINVGTVAPGGTWIGFDGTLVKCD